MMKKKRRELLFVLLPTLILFVALMPFYAQMNKTVGDGEYKFVITKYSTYVDEQGRVKSKRYVGPVTVYTDNVVKDEFGNYIPNEEAELEFAAIK